MQPPFTTPLLLADLRLTPPMRAICHPGSRQVRMCVQPIVNPCPLVSPFTVAIMHHRTRFRVCGITSHYAVFVVRGCRITTGTSANSQLCAINAERFPRRLPYVLTFVKYRGSWVHFRSAACETLFLEVSKETWLHALGIDVFWQSHHNENARSQLRILIIHGRMRD